eukprot:597529-Prorocentrum_lima.AAC.1
MTEYASKEIENARNHMLMLWSAILHKRIHVEIRQYGKLLMKKRRRGDTTTENAGVDLPQVMAQ